MSELPPIRILSEPPPDDVSSFLRLAKADKDPVRFWRSLLDWYKMPDENIWVAEWQSFVFPHVAGDDRWPPANFEGARFIGRAHFEGAEFVGPAAFSKAEFDGGATFERSVFRDVATFDGAAFRRGSTFGSANFELDASFQGTEFADGCACSGMGVQGDLQAAGLKSRGEFWFVRSKVGGTFVISGAFFADRVLFADSELGWLEALNVTFAGEADFHQARLRGGRLFNVTAGDRLYLGIEVDARGSLEIEGIGAFPSSNVPKLPGPGITTWTQGTEPARIEFGPMSLANVRIRGMDLSEVRFQETRDINELQALDVRWPRRGLAFRVADEDDLDAENTGDYRAPSAEEVERIYRGLRKGREDLNDRIGGHDWYYAEMEVGRKHAAVLSLRKWSRTLYKWMSGYGLSALRPAMWLVGVGLIAVGFFSLKAGWCPRSLATGKCLDLAGTCVVVLRALFFQPPQDGVVLVGVGANIVWLVARVIGAAMIVFLGIAFRNQVAR